MSTTDYPNPPRPPLAAEEFNDGAGYSFRGISMIENDGGDWVYAYGHIDPEVYAAAVNDFDREMAGYLDPDDQYTERDVQHHHAVTLAGPDGPEGWLISWEDVTPETPGAFPITVVSR